MQRDRVDGNLCLLVRVVSASQVASLVQTMAGFGGDSGSADGLSTGLVNADTSQQPLLTTAQHV
jgi:hypothetical protein